MTWSIVFLLLYRCRISVNIASRVGMGQKNIALNLEIQYITDRKTCNHHMIPV